MPPPDPPYRYSLLGLRVASELALPELPTADAPGAPDLTVRFEALAPACGAALQVAGETTSLNAAAARFSVRGGCEIAVDPRPGASEAEVRGFLLGPVLGIVCHQRGWLPLHASAVSIGGRAVAFAGASGAGKSTLAAQLARRGHQVLSDDLCVLDLAGGEARILPATPRLRLWPDSLERIGRSPVEVVAAGPGDKHELPFPAAAGGRLERVYLLGGADQTRRFAVEPVGGAAAVEALMANVFRVQYLGPMGRLGAAFAAAAALARFAPVFSVARSGDFADLEHQAEQVGRHVAGTLQRAPA